MPSVVFPLHLQIQISDNKGIFIGGFRMKRYCVKCRAGRIEYIDIIKETSDGFLIRLTRLSDGNEKIIEEAMTRHLFDICLKTGYIYEMTAEASSVA
jgi:hypothetical protein